MKGVLLGLLLLVGAFCLSGCAKSRADQYVPVSGKVVYDDGSPVPTGMVNLEPIDGDNPDFFSAEITADGTFKFPGNGVFPGRYSVSFSASEEEGEISEKNESGTRPLEMADRFMDPETSELTLDVKESGNEGIVFKVSKK